MVDELPAPPVPPDADLRDFQFMPLDIVRLFGSTFHARANDAEWRAGVTLWLKSYHQVPAGSLPCEDIELCRLAELGRDLRMWARIKAMAMHGWSAASDGRLYHGVVSEKVVEAWRRKGEQKVRTLKARIAAMEKRLKDAATDEDKAHIASLLKGLRQSLSQSLTEPVTDKPEPLTKPVTETNRQGQGQGQGYEQGQGDSRVDGAGAPTPPADVDVAIPIELDRRPEAEALKLWNETAERIGLPLAQRLTDPRHKALRTRLRESGGLDGWRSALAKVEASSFLTGKTGRTGEHANWRCDLDFILRQAKFTKLMEGGFDDPPGSTDQGTAYGGSPTRSDGIAAAFARRSVPSGG